MNSTIDVKQVIAVMEKKKYKVYTETNKMNLVGVRSKNLDSGKFDDSLYCWGSLQNGRTFSYEWEITTDPGLFYLLNPITKSIGTAILAEGQYIDTWRIGLHRGEYKALCQIKPVQVFRDKNMDKVLNFDSLAIQKGIFGINIHKSNALNPMFVGKFSAGCQVFQQLEDFQQMMAMAEKISAQGGMFQFFTYTLLNENDFATVKK